MEVTNEEQAAMAITLDDSVRELVRKHIKEALEDYAFVGVLSPYPLGDLITHGVFAKMQASYVFRDAVKAVISDQMSKP